MSDGAARPCPNCGHLNPAVHAQCIYCGEQLTNHGATTPGFITNLLPPRSPRPPARYVAIQPHQDSPAARQLLAAASDHDVAEAGQLLCRQSYTLFTFTEAEDSALSFGAALDRGALDNVIFDQADVDAVEPAHFAANITITQDGRATTGHPYRASLQRTGMIYVRTSAGEELALAPGRLSWACQGTLRAQRQRRAENPHALLNHHHRVEQRRKVIDTYRVLDLYSDLPGPIRLLESATGFDGLGVMAFEHAAGFVRFVSWLEKENPTLIIDDSFRYHPSASAAESPLDKPINLTADWDEWSARSWLVWRGGR